MKKIALLTFILIFAVGFVFAALEIQNNGEIEMSLDLTENGGAGEEDWKVFNVGFINDISSYSDGGITLEDEISSWDKTLSLSVNDELKGTGNTNFVWQIVWPQDFGIKLSGEALDSEGNKINWTTSWTAKKQQVNDGEVEIIDDGSPVSFGVNNDSGDYQGKTILTHEGESTALVSYGYIPLTITTEDISAKKRGEYKATITLTIDPEPTASTGEV